MENELMHKEGLSNKQYLLLIASPILLPILLCLVVIPFISIMSGWLFVAMVFSMAGACLVSAIVSLWALFVSVNSLAHILVLLSIFTLSLGFIYPILCIAVEFFKSYKILYNSLMSKSKELLMKGRNTLWS